MQSRKRRQAIEALPLPGWYGERRKDLLALLDRVGGADSSVGQGGAAGCGQQRGGLSADDASGRGSGGIAGLCVDRRQTGSAFRAASRWAVIWG